MIIQPKNRLIIPHENSAPNKAEVLATHFKRFKDDESYFEDYAGVRMVSDRHVLVRVFKFNPGKDGSLTSPILMVDNAGKVVSSTEVLDSKVLPYVKVIQAPEGQDQIKVGGIYLVPNGEVTGWVDNPDYLYAMQFQRAKGIEPILPEGMERKIPALRKNWELYLFRLPTSIEPTEDDLLTYMIPIQKLIAEVL
jgi:hypothetical protein